MGIFKECTNSLSFDFDKLQHSNSALFLHNKRHVLSKISYLHTDHKARLVYFTLQVIRNDLRVQGVQKHVSLRSHSKLSSLIKGRKKILLTKEKLIKIPFYANSRTFTSFWGLNLPFPRNTHLNARILMSATLSSVVLRQQFSTYR